MSSSDGRCVPAVVGLGISAFSLCIGLAHGGGLLTVFFALVFASIKYMLLLYLCRTQQKSIAWFVVSLGVLGIMVTLVTLNSPNYAIDVSGNLMLSDPLLYGRGRWFNDPSFFTGNMDVSGAIYFGTK